MKRIISITIMFSMLFSSVGIVYADPKECNVRDPEMSIEELAYLDLDEAPAEMKDDIIDARNTIIFSEDWVADGYFAEVYDTDGTLIRSIPQFSELFPNWDIPVAECVKPVPVMKIGDLESSMLNANSDWTLLGSFSIYLKKPGNTNTTSFASLYANPLTIGNSLRTYVTSLTSSETCNIGYTNMSTGTSLGYVNYLSLGQSCTIHGVGGLTVGIRASTHSSPGWSILSVYGGNKSVVLDIRETE